MEAQITVNVRLPCATSAPFWRILQEAEFTSLNYKSSSCTCTAQLRITSGVEWTQPNNVDKYLTSSGRGYRRLLGLEKSDESIRAFVDWVPTWEVAGDQTGDNRSFPRPSGRDYSKCSRILENRVGAHGPEQLIEWLPSWEDVADLDLKSIEEFEGRQEDIFSLLAIIQAVVKEGPQETRCG
ncbi:hypothetical protein Asppvi_005873 [Aspergillus pseudoviridinutans]|uniref:Uncharacterized protein n=1 Tax=Aspergillus pseudoviridinutans TaxID=1517512 RepID=A0A9P3BBP2_9EURO|nr:uncharacterized protein Asppvi_005873 [Aspergillus pseudoviridinutans]GIJ86974.1 hypothetical protein Asppvi_005873 [Aspergillus pseudoviridinutans]